MNFEELNTLEKTIVFAAFAMPASYAIYKIALELWCVAYGFGMTLGLL